MNKRNTALSFILAILAFGIFCYQGCGLFDVPVNPESEIQQGFSFSEGGKGEPYAGIQFKPFDVLGSLTISKEVTVTGTVTLNLKKNNNVQSWCVKHRGANETIPELPQPLDPCFKPEKPAHAYLFSNENFGKVFYRGQRTIYVYTQSSSEVSSRVYRASIFFQKANTWIGRVSNANGDYEWSNEKNWSLDKIPGEDDMVLFNHECVNCSALLNISSRVKGVLWTRKTEASLVDNGRQILTILKEGWRQNRGTAKINQLEVVKIFQQYKGSFEAKKLTFVQRRDLTEIQKVDFNPSIYGLFDVIELVIDTPDTVKQGRPINKEASSFVDQMQIKRGSYHLRSVPLTVSDTIHIFPQGFLIITVDLQDPENQLSYGQLINDGNIIN